MTGRAIPLTDRVRPSSRLPLDLPGHVLQIESHPPRMPGRTHGPPRCRAVRTGRVRGPRKGGRRAGGRGTATPRPAGGTDAAGREGISAVEIVAVPGLRDRFAGPQGARA